MTFARIELKYGQLTETFRDMPELMKLAESRQERAAQSPDELRDTQRRYTNHISTLLNENPMTDARIDLTRIYPETNDINTLREHVDDLKRCLDSLRPIPPEQVQNLQEAFDTQYTYDSNRIEGNTLTLNETAMVIQHGITIGGKSMKDHLEAINHRDAIKHIRAMVDRNEDLSFDSLMAIHSIVLSGIDRENAGRLRNTRVRVAGSAYTFPNPLKVPELIDDFLAYCSENNETTPVVDFAAKIHARLVNIHPFVDGNGRTARLVMNLFLLRSGYVVANISGDKSQRSDYYQALEHSHADDAMTDFVRFILKTEKASLIEYIGMLDPDIESGRGGYYLERISPFLPE